MMPMREINLTQSETDLTLFASIVGTHPRGRPEWFQFLFACDRDGNLPISCGKCQILDVTATNSNHIQRMSRPKNLYFAVSLSMEESPREIECQRGMSIGPHQPCLEAPSLWSLPQSEVMYNPVHEHRSKDLIGSHIHPIVSFQGCARHCGPDRLW